MIKLRTYLPAALLIVALLFALSWGKQTSIAGQPGKGRIAIVGYKPKPGRAEALKSLARTHVQRLRTEGLVTAREPIIMEAKDGTIIEVFEWKSKEALEAAHRNPSVQAMWKEYAEVCDYVPVASVEETKQLFSEFSSLD
jgi:quinol monooxygenase YgiN